MHNPFDTLGSLELSLLGLAVWDGTAADQFLGNG
jgi:hypothetical protein